MSYLIKSSNGQVMVDTLADLRATLWGKDPKKTTIYKVSQVLMMVEVDGDIAKACDVMRGSDLNEVMCAHEFSDSIGLLSDVCSKCGSHNSMDDITKHPIGYDAGMF